MTTLYVPSSADLPTVIANAHGGDRLILAAGASYTCHTEIDVKVPSLAIDANGATIRSTVSGTGIKVWADDFSLSNATVPQAGIFLRLYGRRANISHITASNMTGFVVLDRLPATGTDQGGADGSTIVDCTGQHIGGDFVYNSCDNITLQRLTVKDSAGEHNIRCSRHSNGHVPNGLLVDSCQLWNANGKETLAMRDVMNATTTNCDFWNYVRAGQVSNPPMTLTVGNLLMRTNRFHNKAYLQLNQGVKNAIIDSNTFEGGYSFTAVHAQGPHLTVTVSNNIEKPMPGETSIGPTCLIQGLGPADLVTQQNNLVI